MADTTYTLFKTNLPSLQYVFADGKIAVFKEGRFYTSDKLQIKELNHAIAHGSPSFFFDPEEPETTLEKEDPRQRLKNSLRDEIIQEYLKNIQQDLGESNPSGMTGANTDNIQALTTSPTLTTAGATALADMLAKASTVSKS